MLIYRVCRALKPPLSPNQNIHKKNNVSVVEQTLLVCKCAGTVQSCYRSFLVPSPGPYLLPVLASREALPSLPAVSWQGGLGLTLAGAFLATAYRVVGT